MKGVGILNRDLSALVAAMGHYDRLVVSDAGFPVPPGVSCIDLSLRPSTPTVLEVLEIIAVELEVEEFYVASEAANHLPNREKEVIDVFPRATGHAVPHAQFKQLAAHARGLVRTGEFTSFANVILVSGVVY